MGKRVLPWADLSGPVYHAQEPRPRKKWVTAGGWIMSAILLVCGFTTRWRVAAVFGVLYALALLMDKTTVVTRRGMETFHDMKITTNYELWKWEEIRAVLRDDGKKPVPGLTGLHLVNGNRSRKLWFTKADAEKVMALAREMRPDMVVEEVKAPATAETPGRQGKKNRKW